ncbi:MAG: hypothetical protein E7323_01095 [Clostridiales bacterium]|nr:hypothetical protein [Clostridiales bacterium]
MKNRKLILCVSTILALAISLTGTLAYLTDTDADVNVMTLGNVDILQNEQERVKDAEGNYTTDLKQYSNNQMLLPAVYDGTIGEPERMKDLVVGDYAITLSSGVRTFPNYMDKIVTVTNRGNSDAYVRTIIAKPAGVNDLDDSNGVSDVWLHTNVLSDTDTTPPSGWYWGKSMEDGEWPQTYTLKNVEINGALYDISVATNVNPIKPKQTTGPNLVGLYLDNDVDFNGTEYTAKNEAGEIVTVWSKPEIKVLVLSQAVQTAGFTDAFVALKEAFGDVTAETAKAWFESIGTDIPVSSPGDENDTNDPPLFPTEVSTFEELVAAFAQGGAVKLKNDIELKGVVNLPEGVSVNLDMNGKTLTAADASVDPMIWTDPGSSLVITGDGTVDLGDYKLMSFIVPCGDLTIKNGTYLKNNAGGTEDKYGAFIVGTKNGGTVIIEDGYFDGGFYDSNADKPFTETEADKANRGKPADKNAYRMAVKYNVAKLLNTSSNTMIVYGGTFVGANPAYGDEGCALPITPDYLRPWSYYQGTFLEGQQVYDDKLDIPAGYTITEGTASDGRPTYTVTYTK